MPVTPQFKTGTTTPLLTPGGAPAINSDCCCGSSGCACIDVTQCTNCTNNDTPTQFHVTFTGISACGGCVACAATGVSFNTGSTGINGTYLLTRNGSCAWTTTTPNSPAVTATEYASTTCTGFSSTVNFAVNLVRISATQFHLQIADPSGTILLFDGTYTTTPCCASFTVSSSLTTCGCAGAGPTIYTLATGGSGSVTPC